ncbi:MAG: hypothetical protein K2W96_15565, partial [Gemmataceae bacterium]|nr:hypothetical protein [Gemmataceae bacterium]
MINLLRTLSIGYIGQHKARTVLVVMSIAIGVAAMVATQSLAKSLKLGLEDAVNPLAKVADLLVSKGQAGVPLAMAQRIRDLKVPGIKEASPFVMVRLSLADLENRSAWMFGIELPQAKDAAKLLDKNPLGVEAAVRADKLGLADLLRVAAREVALVTPGIVEDLAALPTPIT